MGLFGSGDSVTRARLASIERKLDLIMAGLGIEAPKDDTEPYLELVRQNRKIEAIKLYRQQTGAGLAEAKAAIDRLSQ